MRGHPLCERGHSCVWRTQFTLAMRVTLVSGAEKVKKKIWILGLIFSVIVGVTFSLGIYKNPSFNINDFCNSLSSEFIGWILAVTVFQYYYDEKMAARKSSQKKNDDSFSVADEILKFKSLMDSGVITQEEFEAGKKKLLTEGGKNEYIS